MGIDRVPVVLKIAEAVAHGMRIFTHNVGALLTYVSRIFFHSLYVRIHGANNICIPIFACLFKLYRAAFIPFFDPFISIMKNLAVTTFVS